MFTRLHIRCALILWAVCLAGKCFALNLDRNGLEKLKQLLVSPDPANRPQTIVYHPPSFNLQNLTLETGAIFDLTDIFNPSNPNVLGTVSAFGVICQMDQYNRGKGLIPFDGRFQLYAFDTQTEFRSSVYSSMYLLRSNLYIDQQRMSPYPKIAAMIGSGDFRAFLSFSPFFGGFNLPTIGYGSRFVGLERDSFSTGISQTSNTTIFELSGIFSQAITDITIQLAETLGWSLGAYIFVANSFGYQGEAQLLRKLERSTKLIPRCSNIVPIDSAIPTQITEFVTCVKSTYQLNYVILYMAFEDGIRIVEKLIDAGIPDTVMFLITLREPAVGLADTTITTDFRLASRVMYIRSAYSDKIAQTTDSCLSQLKSDDPSSFGDLTKYLIAAYERIFRCVVAPSEGVNGRDALPVCEENVLLRPGTSCYCTLTEIQENYNDLATIANAADSVNLLAQAISLIRNNCTYLNENASNINVDFCSLTSITPEILGAAIRAVDFDGYTGRISFYQATPARMTASYEVVQYDQDLKPVKIATYINSVFTLDTNAITFPNGQKPPSEVLPSIADLNDAYVVVFFAFACAGVLLTLLLAVPVFRYRRHRTIRKSSPFFLSLLLLGVAFVFISQIINSVGLTSATLCILHDFFLLMGITLVLGNMLCRNYRIYRIFSNRSSVAMTISNVDLVLINGACLAMTLALWAVFTFAGGILEPVTITSESNPFYKYSLCEVSSSWFQTFRIIAYYVYFVLLTLAVGILGFLTRNVRGDYNESKQITILAYMYIMMAVIFAPLYYLSGDSTDSDVSRYLDETIPVELCAFATLIILSVPMFRDFRKQQRLRQR